MSASGTKPFNQGFARGLHWGTAPGPLL